MTKFCDLCLQSVDVPFAIIKMLGEEDLITLCNKECFYSGMAELIFAYLKNNNANEEVLRSMGLMIDEISLVSKNHLRNLSTN